MPNALRTIDNSQLTIDIKTRSLKRNNIFRWLAVKGQMSSIRQAEDDPQYIEGANFKCPGFTLVELLVVIGILGTVVGSSLLFLTDILKGSNQAEVVSEIKQNGQVVLDVIDRQIRNAESVENFTVSFMTPPVPVDVIKLNKPNTTNGYYIACFNRDIAASPKKNGWIGIMNSPTPPALASDFLKLTNTSEVSGIDVECDTSTFAVSGLPGGSYPQVVQVRFKVSQGVEAPKRLDFNAISEFKTTISLRRYSF